MAFGHGGNLKDLSERSGLPAEEVLDFSANINPLGPPENLRCVISRNVERVVHYPDPKAETLAEAIARRYSFAPEQIVVGNGSSEIFYALPRALGLRQAVLPVPSYADYAAVVRLNAMEVETVLLQEADDFRLDWETLDSRLQGSQVVFLGQPNNPTGMLFDPAEFRRFVADHPEAIFIVDEAFADFVEGYQTLARDMPANVIVVCSMTKFYAIPGLRLGYAVAPVELAERIRAQLPPWSVNVFAQAAGEAVLNDTEYAVRSREFVSQQRAHLFRELSKIPGLYVYPGRANFLLVRIDRSDINAPGLACRLLADGIAIRVCDNYEGLDKRFFRLAVRTQQENDRLCRAIFRLFGCKTSAPMKKQRPALMFQGTSSSAGKSIMTAAMCRILLQDGFRVAPFKAQNMSLNSFVTREGGEIGRAQAVQAQACRLEPDVRMNPVLLKPNSDTGSQVIIRGKPVGNMNVTAYTQFKTEAFKTVMECYDSLAGEYDAVILEGAGSPGEINLKHHDIVNMRMARYAESPVLLVGDIDRGGVFASFVGTMEVLAQWERQLVAGFLVNKFRGDKSLLGPALDYVADYTGRPVLGVIPYLRNLNIPEEDSVEFKSGSFNKPRGQDPCVEVAVIDLPHISNFTDFDALRLEGDVYLRIIRSLEELNNPDAVIIPGSKNVIGDLKYLESSGLAQRLKSLAKTGQTEIVGICGGFQILGKAISDPHGIETSAGEVTGLSLLDIRTVLAVEKTLRCVQARHTVSGHLVSGYEIHHGQTGGEGLVPIIERSDGEVLGVSTASHRIWGTYLHGVFDADEFRRWFIDGLRRRRGMEPAGRVLVNYEIETALDNLADVVRQNLPMDQIYKLMGL
ncbi:MAG: cobyric acid synthase [Phycisphaerae bacterium]